MPVVLVFFIHQGYPGDPGPPGPLNFYKGSDARGEATAVNCILNTIHMWQLVLLSSPLSFFLLTLLH